MKSVRPALIAVALLLAGCASSAPQTGSDSGATWWNPLTYSWSSLAPWNWFGSSLAVNEQGVGELTASTAMNETAIGEALGGNYQIRKGMRSENGGVVTFFQAVSDKQVKVEVTGQSTVERIDVTDRAIISADGNKIGTPFRDIFRKAFGACDKGTGADSQGVECAAPGSQHISYLFTGEWHGPEGLMPPDETLQNWTISKIIWRK
ncbi:RpoE-regulated lipoprotein [Erwinia sp. P7711]|uniref:RpoE-regulated lipoprotein n=1 Tax=Erwinia sp. P7711 TaxID=3141451 RepID=UPI00319D5887